MALPEVGALVSRKSWPVTLNGVKYQIDLGGFIRRPLNASRQLQDQGAEPSESTLASHNTWKRTIRDWSMGAGQDWFDENDPLNDRRRFRKSKGIDIWTDRQLTLLPFGFDGGTIGSNGATAGLLRAGDTYVYGYADGSAFHITMNGTVTACTGEAGTFSDLTAWDGYVYFAGSGTLQRVTVGGTAVSTFGSLTPDLIEAVAGRLLAADGVSLYEIDATGAKQGGTDIFQHPNSSWTWSALEGAPNGIYAAGDDGYTSTVYLVPVVDATGDLVAPYPVLPLPPGEIVREIKHLAGLIFLATNKGVRMCTINGSGFLGMGPAVTAFGDTQCLAVDGNYLYAGWSSEPVDGEVAVGRIAPDRWTQQMVPRYACDVAHNDTGTVRAVAVLNGQVFFMFDDGSSATKVVYASPTVLEDLGYLYSGGISYLTPENKRFFMVEGQCAPLQGSITVNVDDYMDGTSGLSLVMDTATQTEETAYDSTPLETEAVEAEIILARAVDTTSTPTLHRVTLGSSPIRFPTEEIILPVILKSRVGSAGATESLDIQAEWEALHTLFLTQERVSFTFGSRTETVTVDAVASEPSGALPGLVDWNLAKDWPEGVWYIRLLTQEA